MDKYSKLLRNAGIFLVSQFASKFLVFIMLPLYTGYMTSNEYATADMVTTSANLIIPVLTLSLPSAVLRFIIENKNNAFQSFIYSIKIIFFGFILLIFCHPFIKTLNLFGSAEWLFYAYYITNATESLFDQIARGLGRIKLVGLLGILKTITIILVNIVLIAFFKLGVTGYLFAYIGSYVISIIIYSVCLYKDINKAAYNGDKRKLHKQLLYYSIPLIPNSISWWLITSFNKYIILYIKGNNDLGLFSAASKIPSIMIALQGIISEAVVLSVVEEYEKNKNDKYFSNLYNSYNSVMVIGCSILIIFTKFAAKILLSNEFYNAWPYIPFLLISTVFGAMSGYIGNFYNASKNNKGMFISTLIGGITSIILNSIIINIFGIIGTTIANLCAYVIIWIYRLIDTKKYVKFNIAIRRDIIGYILLCIQAVLLITIKKGIALVIAEYGILVLLLVMFGKNILVIAKELIFRIKNRLAVLKDNKILHK